MKKYLASLMLLLSFSVFSQEMIYWSDMELDYGYILNERLTFENGVEIAPGEKFTLVDTIPGFGIPYMYFEFVNPNCKNPEDFADHGIHLMKDSYGREHKVIMKLEPYCQLLMYVHGSKIHDYSIFY